MDSEPAAEPGQGGEWPLAGRVIVSGLLAVHFLGVLLAPLALPLGHRAPPLVASVLHHPLVPWLDAALLNQPWRFFAPEPGPITIQLFRVERENGTAVWIEHPRVEDFRGRSPALHRELAMAMQFDREIGPSASDPRELQLSPVGSILVESYVRHVAGRSVAEWGTPRAIEFWVLHHRPLSPEQVTFGWDSNDLRTWSACHVGRFAPDGRPVDEGAAPTAVPVPRVVGRWIADSQVERPMESDVPLVARSDAVQRRLLRDAPTGAGEIESELSRELLSLGRAAGGTAPGSLRR